MSVDTPTRAEFEAFQALVAEALEQTGCTNPANVEADRKLRQFIAVWDSEDARRDRETQREMLDWFRHQRASRDDARQRLGDWAARLGLYTTVVTVLTGFVSGASWLVITALRWANGGAP
jgi:hypothetical protein